MEKEEAEKTDKQTGSMEPQIMIETLTTEQTKINTNSNNRAYNITPLTINIILGICIWLFCNKNYKNITIKEDDICIGTMCYSYMLGIDAGTEYLVSIYYNDGNAYKYEVTEGNITIEGYRAENKKVNGIINSKDDLIKLDEKYKSKKSGNLGEAYIEYKVKGKEKVKDINDFIEEVFSYKNEEIENGK